MYIVQNLDREILMFFMVPSKTQQSKFTMSKIFKRFVGEWHIWQKILTICQKISVEGSASIKISPIKILQLTVVY